MLTTVLSYLFAVLVFACATSPAGLLVYYVWTGTENKVGRAFSLLTYALVVFAFFS